MLGAEDYLDKSDEAQQGYVVAVAPYLGIVVRMADAEHTPDAEAKIGYDDDCELPCDWTVPPVEILAVVEQGCHLEQQCCPQRASEPVDAEERELAHEAEVAHAAGQHDEHDEHHGGREEVHVGPVIIIHQAGGDQVGQLHAAENHDVQHGEEHREVALRGHPQLYGGHTLEGAFYLADALNEAYGPEQRQEGDVGSHQVAHEYAECRGGEQCLVGEAELHSEEHRKEDGHAREVGVQTHLQILAQKRVATHHLVERSKIDASRNLEHEGEHHVYPRLYLLRYEVAEHGHGERPV